MENNNNILYIPIQINGGTEVPTDLLDRELFIKNGVLHVGIGNGHEMVVLGEVVPNATITDATLNGKLYLSDTLVVKNLEDVKDPKDGQIIFVDENPY